VTGAVRELARSAADTEAFGARLAGCRPPGRELAVLFLSGELGAGKTTLARGFLGAMGVTADVRSPTYTLLELYPAGEITLLHADLYRLQDPAELDTLGLRDYGQSGYLWLIEWPERGAGHLPAPDLTLTLVVLPDAHTIEARAHSALGERWLAQLRAA